MWTQLKLRGSRWWVSYTHPLTHERVRRSLGTDNEADAQAIAAEIDALIAADVARQSGAGGSDRTLAQLTDAWLRTRKPELAANSLKAYYNAVAHILDHFGPGTLVSHISPERCHQYAASRAANPRTINQEIMVLRALLQCAVDWGWLLSSPAAKLKQLRHRAKFAREPLTHGQAVALVKASRENDSDALLIGFLLGCGLRIHEALAVRGCDWQPERAVLRLPVAKEDRAASGGRRQEVPVPEWVSEVLVRVRGLQQEERLLPMGWTKATRRLRAITAAAGITRKVRAHDLRATAITEIVRAAGLKAGQAFARHSSPTTTAGYTGDGMADLLRGLKEVEYG